MDPPHWRCAQSDSGADGAGDLVRTLPNLSPVLNPGSAGEAPIHDQVLALVDPEPLPRECLAEVLQAGILQNAGCRRFRSR